MSETKPTRDETLALLRGGTAGVEEWNRRKLSSFVDFSFVDLRYANLEGAKLAGADLRYALLGGANLHGADLFEADLRYAELEGIDMHGAFLAGANLEWCCFVEADVSEANFYRANLHGATFLVSKTEGIKLVEANTWGLNPGVSLRGADLQYTHIRTGFELCDMTEAIMGATTIACRLDLVKGLNTIRHMWPSTLSLDALSSLRNDPPWNFLRACGVDRQKFSEFIRIMQSGRRIQSCFISYSGSDVDFVERLQKSLNERGIDYWYAPVHGEWGHELTNQISKEISNRDRVLLVCSMLSLESNWVRWEIDKALTEEKKRGARVLYPVMIDDALLHWDDPRASRLREILAADFRRAQEGEAFTSALDRLCESLGY